MQPEPATPGGANPGTRAILECLNRVTDPELDESVVAMGFIDRIDIDGGSVTVTFRLPTFLCSANFAFLMAEDMKMALEQLPGVTRATVVLKDHFAADRINRGIAGSLPFEAVFSDEASDGLSHIRRTFREKAFLGRQSVLLDLLLQHRPVSQVLGLTVADLATLMDDGDRSLADAAARYLVVRRHDGGPADVGCPAFTDLDGTPLTRDTLPDHRRATRRTLRASRANAEMCRMVLANRRNGTDIEALEKRAEGSEINTRFDHPRSGLSDRSRALSQA